jgi:hypothetical protein
MLTLFSIPKAFSGSAGIHQANAIGSWIRLGAECDVILFGDEPGMTQIAAKFGVRHVPELQRNSEGTPILSDVFSRADALARHPLLCFVNSDIVLFNDILAASNIVAARRRSFLMVSSRFSLQIEEALAFGPDWDQSLRERAVGESRMYPAGGSDIFVYPRGLFGAVPPFAIGRGYWDNWLIRRSVQLGASVIDATGTVVAVHLDHDYRHVVQSRPEGPSEADVLASAEGQRNLALAGGRGRLYTVYDATAVLTADGRLVSTLRPSLIWRRIKAWLRRMIATSAPVVLLGSVLAASLTH